MISEAELIDQVAVRRVLVASTAHVSPETRDWLDEQGRLAANHKGGRRPWPALPIMAGIYGWQFYAQEEFDDDLPEEVKTLMACARRHGADWVELDADGDVIEGLPTWEW